MVTLDHSVIVVGDGPAGLALGAAFARAGVDAIVVGEGGPWQATYSTWVTPRLGPSAEVLAWQGPVAAWGARRHELAVPYGVFDNDRLQDLLRTAAVHRRGRVVSVVHRLSADEASAEVTLADGEVLRAALVVDASGPAARFSAAPGAAPGVPVQTAYGLVLDHLPDGLEPTLMDWRPPTSSPDATFLYVVGLGGGRWLVEETSLARSPAMPVDDLRARLAERLGADLTGRAERVEQVVIPMIPGAPPGGSAVVPFGAAARGVHPATGYSVADSLVAAPRVAAAVATALGHGHRGARLEAAAWRAVWPRRLRVTRRLHDYGAGVLLALGPDVGVFFDAFFDLPSGDWLRYLRTDTSPGEVSATMWRVFAAAPWSVRRRLVTGRGRHAAGR